MAGLDCPAGVAALGYIAAGRVERIACRHRVPFDPSRGAVFADESDLELRNRNSAGQIVENLDSSWSVGGMDKIQEGCSSISRDVYPSAFSNAGFTRL